MKKFMLIIFMILILIILKFNRLDTLLLEPMITATEFLQQQPYMNIGNIILIQPSSSILVFALGIVGIYVAYYFYKTRLNMKSRLWWAIAMLLWGIGAISAGLSYQSFGYMLKAYGREFVLYTSWPEVVYSIITVWSIASMAIAVSYASATGKLRERIKIFSYITSTIYTLIVFLGIILPSKLLLSFNLLVACLVPFFIIYFVCDIKIYIKTKELKYLKLILCWISLGVVMISYYAYSLLDITNKVWAKGFWFSDNDVLHLLLIIWMFYIRFVLGKDVKDIK